MEDLVKQEKERVDKWNTYYKDLEMEHSKDLHISIGYRERVDKAESQVLEMAQAIKEAAQKAQKDVEKN